MNLSTNHVYLYVLNPFFSFTCLVLLILPSVCIHACDLMSSILASLCVYCLCPCVLVFFPCVHVFYVCIHDCNLISLRLPSMCVSVVSLHMCCCSVLCVHAHHLHLYFIFIFLYQIVYKWPYQLLFNQGII